MEILLIPSPRDYSCNFDVVLVPRMRLMMEVSLRTRRTTGYLDLEVRPAGGTIYWIKYNIVLYLHFARRIRI